MKADMEKRVHFDANLLGHESGEDSEAEEGVHQQQVEAEGAKKKKKKKRKNRKKKAAAASHLDNQKPGGDDEDEDDLAVLAGASARKLAASNSSAADNDFGTAMAQPSALNNPMAVTIWEVVGRGYQQDEVQQMVSEMWDKGMDYDNPDLVVDMIESKRAPAYASSHEPPAPAVHEDEDNEVVEPAVEAAAAPEPVSLQVEDDAEEEDGTGDEGEEGGEAMGEEEVPVVEPPVVYEAPLIPEPAPAPAPAQQGAMPLNKRLELAASMPNTQDSLVALYNWASLVDPSEMDALFESKALDLLLANVMSAGSGGDPSMPTALHGDLRAFLLKVLLPASASEDQVASSGLDVDRVLEQLWSVVARLRALHTLQPVGTSSVSGLAAQLAGCLKGYRQMSQTMASLRSHLSQYDEGIEAVTLQMKGLSTGETVRDLFMRRDVQHRAAHVHSQACAALIRTTNASGFMPPQGVGTDAVVQQLLAEGPASGHAQNALGRRQEIEHIQAMLQGLKNECEAQVFPLQTEADLCQEKAAQLTQRAAALRREAEEAEAERGAVLARRQALMDSIHDLRGSAEQRAAAIDSEHSGLVQSLRHAEACEALGAAAGALENHLQQTVDKVCSLHLQQTRHEANSRCSQFLIASEAYLRTEVKCVSLMKQRIESSQAKIQTLEREVVEYDSLGMSQMRSDLLKRAEGLRTNIDEDQGCIDGITQVVREMYNGMRLLLQSAEQAGGGPAPGGAGGAGPSDSSAPCVLQPHPSSPPANACWASSGWPMTGT